MELTRGPQVQMGMLVGIELIILETSLLNLHVQLETLILASLSFMS